MLWMFNQFRSLIVAIASARDPKQLAWGGVVGMFWGLIPFHIGFSLLMIFLLLLFNVHVGMGLLMAGLFALISPFLDSITHQIGYFLLVDATSLKEFWMFIFRLPFVSFLHFNNTVSLGNLILGIGLMGPVYIGLLRFVRWFRHRIQPTLDRFWIVRVVKGSKLYLWYRRLVP